MLIFKNKKRKLEIKKDMETISVEIEDSILKQAGISTMKEYLKRQVHIYKLQMLAVEISESIIESDIDYENELKQAKEKTWQEYKKNNLSNILP